MKAVIKEHEGKGITIKEVAKPNLQDGEVLVQIEAASICGSDLHMYESMKAYEWVSMPVILGHEFVGKVIEVSNGEHQHLVNQRVIINPYIPCGYCDNCLRGNTNLCDAGTGSISKTPTESLQYGFRKNGGMAEFAAINASNVLPIPNQVPVEVAGMLEAIAIGVHAIERADIKPGSTAVVIGPGPIGLSLVTSLSNFGFEKLIVTGLRKDEKRLSLAKEIGATHIVYADEEDVLERISALTNHNGVDHIFDTSGFHGSLVDAIRMSRKGGEVLLVGISSLPSEILTHEIVRGEVTIKGVYGVTKETMQRAIAMAASGNYAYSKLVSHVISLQDAKKGFELGLNKEAIKVVLKP